jgi:plastocyanin
MRRARPGMFASAIVAAAGLAVLAACGTSATSPTAPGAAPAGQAWSYYRSMMGRFHGGPMTGGNGAAGYRWMMGGVAAPAWMRGHALPGYMMGSGGMMGSGTRDPGKIMGRLWANAPGPRVSPAQAARLGSVIPAGATVDRAANRITFAGASARFAVVASPAGGPDETFRIAGLVNPDIVLRAGTRVSIELVNADPDTAHGIVITGGNGANAWMPMMTTRIAFPGASLWFLGNPTSAGMHAGTFAFVATRPGAYRYLCPVPGHASKGMIGAFTVR